MQIFFKYFILAAFLWCCSSGGMGKNVTFYFHVDIEYSFHLSSTDMRKSEGFLLLPIEMGVLTPLRPLLIRSRVPYKEQERLVFTALVASMTSWGYGLLTGWWWRFLLQLLLQLHLIDCNWRKCSAFNSLYD